MESLLAENDTAIQQRYAHWKMIQNEQDQAERAQRIERVNREIRRETHWYRTAHILLGAILGTGLTLLSLSFGGEPNDPAPVVQVNKSTN